MGRVIRLPENKLSNAATDKHAFDARILVVHSRLTVLLTLHLDRFHEQLQFLTFHLENAT